MTKAKKQKPLTALEKAERRNQDLEYAIYQMTQDLAETRAQLRVLKAYIDTEEFSKYTAKDFITGMFSTLSNNVELMMLNAELEY